MSLVARPEFPILTLALALLSPLTAAASFDEFDEENAPTRFQLLSTYLTLTLKGELELELHNLEGRGGPGYDSSTDTLTLGTRSLFVELDTLQIALRIGFPRNVAVNTAVELSLWDARAGAVWLDWRGQAPSWLEHHVEVGYHTPIVSIDRSTERYPLIATVYWREPEIHAAWEGRACSRKGLCVDLGLSLAIMRPLDLAGVQESTAQRGTINVLSYGAARVYSGNRPIVGGALRLSLRGASVEAFAFVGALAAQGGTDILNSALGSYRELPGQDGEGANRFAWFGGRARYEGRRLRATVEGIGSQEGLLQRWGLYGQLSYIFDLRPNQDLLRTFETLLRYEVYRIVESDDVLPSGRSLRSPAPANGASWDYDILTIAILVALYRDIVKLRFELYFIWEHNGVHALSIPNEPLRNNELLLQGEVRF